MENTANILAALMTPALLYAGAVGAAVPILIHLLNKRRFRRVEWAATAFLLEALRENRRRLRIEELILLAMRCLAMFLIGLTLARWFIQPSSPVLALGSRARADHILVLDDSYSMRLQDRPTSPDDPATAREPSGSSGPGDETVFSRAVTAGLRLIEQIAAESPGDSLTLLLTSRPDRPLYTAATAGQINREALAEELRSIKPSHRTANFPAAMRAVRAMLDARRSGVRAVVHVFSDYQAIDWMPEADTAAGNDEGERVTGPAEALRSYAGDEHGLQLVLVDVGRTVESNLCVESIEPEQAQPVVGVASRYTVWVRNFGRERHDGSQLQIYVGDAAQPPVAVPAIGPGHSTEVPVEVAFGDEGRQHLTVEIEPDLLPVDNVRSHVVPVVRALKVRIVNGEGSPDPYQDEVFLLAVALRPEGLEFSGNDVTVIDESALEGVDFQDVHAVILANVYRLSEEVTHRLEQYAAAGGGVIIFLGDQVDPDLYNRIAWRDGRGLLPASLGEIRSAADARSGTPLGEFDASHPAMQRFVHASISLFSDLAVWQWFECTVEGTATQATDEAVVDPPTATAPAADGPGPARVLMRLQDPDRSPLIVERSYGQGHVILITTSADKEWNNAADHPVYVVLAMELVQQVARRPATQDARLAGEPVRMPLDPTRFQVGAMLKLPTYPATPAIHVEAQPDRETGLPVLNWTDTEYPGVYTFELVTAAGETEARPVAVNVDPREGDLRRADQAALLASMNGLPVTLVSGEEAGGGGAEPPARRELWPAVLAALAAVLMIEQILAWWFGTGRRPLRAFRAAGSAAGEIRRGELSKP